MKKSGSLAAGDATARSKAAAALALFDATVALFHRLRVAAEEVHGQGALTAGRRGVLRDLHRRGPQTVPQMARRRPVSRQHIQTLVNGLLADGLVEAIDNPAHKRSSLLRLTARGAAAVGAMRRREERLLASTRLDLAERDLRRAAAVLRDLREFLASPLWRRRVLAGRRVARAQGRPIGAPRGRASGPAERRPSRDQR